MPTCIYCREFKSSRGFAKEHVLTRVFCGAGENRTLVCHDCNGRFSAMQSHWSHSAGESPRPERRREARRCSGTAVGTKLRAGER